MYNLANAVIAAASEEVAAVADVVDVAAAITAAAVADLTSSHNLPTTPERVTMAAIKRDSTLASSASSIMNPPATV
jgi:hypothetical protein